MNFYKVKKSMKLINCVMKRNTNIKCYCMNNITKKCESYVKFTFLAAKTFFDVFFLFDD